MCKRPQLLSRAWACALARLRIMLLLSFFLSVLFSQLLTGVRRKRRMFFSSWTIKWAILFPPLLFIRLFYSFFPNPAAWEEVTAACAHSPRLSNWWAFQWLCLPRFLPEAKVCLQTEDWALLLRELLWASGLLAAERLSCCFAVFISCLCFLTIDRKHPCTSRQSCSWKESLPPTSGAVEVCFFSGHDGVDDSDAGYSDIKSVPGLLT